MSAEAGTAAEEKVEASPKAPLREVPAALKGRAKIIHSDNPEVDGVLVERWNIEKSQLVIPEIFAMWRDLPNEARQAAYKLGADIKTGDVEQAMAIMDIATIAIEHCLKRTLYLIRLSVAEADRDKVNQMDMDEVIDLVEGIIEVNPNLIPKLKKKGPEMFKKFAPLFGGKKRNTP